MEDPGRRRTPLGLVGVDHCLLLRIVSSIQTGIASTLWFYGFVRLFNVQPFVLACRRAFTDWNSRLEN